MASNPTLILAPRVTDDSVKIWRSARAMGWNVERLASWRVPEKLIDPRKDYVIYAEPLFAEAVADQLGLVLLEPPVNWLAHLPHSLRGRQVNLTTLGEARHFSKPTFVKPAEGKTFEAKVYHHAEDFPAPDVVEDSVLVLTSEPVSFVFEVRCFVLNGALLGMSPYWRNDSLADGPNGDWPFLADEKIQAEAFASQVLSAHSSHPPAFVLDIGLARESGWAVVEANPCWGAGLYGCDAECALRTAQAAIRRRAEMTEQDWLWTSPRIRPHIQNAS